MADDSDENDKTEAASAKRVAEAMEEGQIPLGREINAVAAFAVGTAALMTVGVPLRDSLIRLFAASAGGLASPDLVRLLPLIARPLALALAACAAAGAAGAIAYLVQTRGRIWPHLVLPDLSKVFSGGKLGQVFSKQVWVDLAFALVKVVTVGATIWSCMRDEFMTLPALLYARTDVQFGMLFGPLCKGAVKVLTVMGLWAGVDIALARYRFNKKMKMTKAEARREAKEDEGNPMMKAKRRRRHRELSRGRAAVEVPRADALIVNPTHIAIAIRYRAGEDSAPRVTAKGKGVLAETMRDLARDNGIPIVENIQLARLLWKRVKVGKGVPSDTFKAVAAVLAYVYRLTGQRGSAAGGGR
ncbi:MAG TPA: EscU/YscU/HrcU family type III secretion system export apparatus switch protein [Polyangia bacterium]|jgi:flagellar biosynthesis protein FlhB|nr:EscU/YscU/HrcU family type III secretion system export apparatus switch protein [Polyangia bacterium]